MACLYWREFIEKLKRNLMEGKNRKYTRPCGNWEVARQLLSLSLSMVTLSLVHASFYLSVLSFQRQMLSASCLVLLLHNFGNYLTLVYPILHDNPHLPSFLWFHFLIEKYLIASQCIKRTFLVPMTVAKGLAHTWLYSLKHFFRRTVGNVSMMGPGLDLNSRNT